MGLLVDLIKELPQAAVLKEHLALADRKIALLTEENAALKAENTVLKEIAEKYRQQEEAQKQLAQRTAVASELSPDEVRILVFVSQNERPTSAAVVAALQISATKADFYLDRLEERGYLWSMSLGDPAEYGLHQKGREYLIQQDLA